MPFITMCHPAVKNLKQILMEHWSLIHNQPLLKTIFTKPPMGFILNENQIGTMFLSEYLSFKANKMLAFLDASVS